MDLGAVLWAVASFLSGIGAVWAAWTGLKRMRARNKVQDAQLEQELEAARTAARDAQREAERLAAELHETRMRELE